jgi:tellurite resistance protein TerC
MDRVVARGIRAVRRVVVTVVGMTILLGGVALLVLPGPAFVVIPIGLAVLALEFEWARDLLRRAREVWKPPSAGDS